MRIFRTLPGPILRIIASAIGEGLRSYLKASPDHFLQAAESDVTETGFLAAEIVEILRDVNWDLESTIKNNLK